MTRLYTKKEIDKIYSVAGDSFRALCAYSKKQQALLDKASREFRRIKYMTRNGRNLDGFVFGDVVEEIINFTEDKTNK